MSRDLDYVLAGGGLQSGLIALALLQRESAPRLAIFERELRWPARPPPPSTSESP